MLNYKLHPLSPVPIRLEINEKMSSLVPSPAFLGRNGFLNPRTVYDPMDRTFNSDEAKEDVAQLALFAMQHVHKPFPK